MVIFTEEEMEWIIKEPFNWHVDEKCPEKLKEQIQKKFDAINRDEGD